MALLATGFLMTAAAVAYDMSLRSDLDAAEVRVHRLRRAVERAQLEENRPEASPEDDRGRVLAMRGSSRWQEFFETFESVADDAVTLLVLSCDGSEVTVSGEAKHLEAALDYVRRLQERPVLATVRLTEYEIAKDHPQRPVRFSVAATWKEPAK